MENVRTAVIGIGDKRKFWASGGVCWAKALDTRGLDSRS